MAASGPPKNWHWRTKDCRPWAKEWFQSNAIVSSGDVKIDKVKDVIGECELGMRKSKFVTIYDLRLELSWTAGDDVAGDLTVLEISHDMDESEYTFEAALTSGSGPEANKHLQTAKKALADQLRPIFQLLPDAMIKAHGKDIFVDESGSNTPVSGTATPAASSTTSAPAPAPASGSAASVPAASKPSKAQNTATVRLESQFMVSANDLWDILTNEKRIPDWSRNPAKFKLEEGSDFELFGGSVRGQIKSFSPPNELVQSWTAPTWNGHHGTLTTKLVQNSDSTTLVLTLSGVPVGREEDTERNLDGFYIRALKQIGLGALL